jgi:DNA-binding MarR family transcriptional regulator
LTAFLKPLRQVAAFGTTSFSRLAGRMETGGLVEGSPDPINTRATLLRLTAQGEERIAEAIAVHQPSARTRFTNVRERRNQSC